MTMPMFSAQDDAVSDDINTTLESDNVLGGKTTGLICNATVVRDTTSTTTNTITITYAGANCQGNVTRTGVVTLSMAKHTRWKDVGAVLTVSAQNLKINVGTKTLTLNGTKTITNVTGHLLKDLASFSPIIHTITSSNMSASFDNGNQPPMADCQEKNIHIQQWSCHLSDRHRWNHRRCSCLGKPTVLDRISVQELSLLWS